MEIADSPKPKRRRWILRAGLALLLAALLYFAGFLAAIHIIGGSDRAESADVIIVLGAGLGRDGRPGWALTRRSERAADLWQAGIAPRVLCTGAQAEGSPRSEASACHEILIRRGVSAAAILTEEMSRSTEESAAHSWAILEGLGLNRAVLVSDSYHMLRAKWLFSRTGLTVFGSPVPSSRINNPLFYPYSLFREFVAFHWYLLKEALNIPITHLSGL